MSDLKRSLLIISFLVGGCSEDLKMESHRWSDTESAPTMVSGLEAHAMPLRRGAQRVIFEKQKVLGVEIRDSFLKEVIGEKPQFISSRWASQVPMAFRGRLLLAKMQKPFVEKSIRRRHPHLHERRWASRPELLIEGGKILWLLTLESDQGRLEGVYLTLDLEILKIESLGSGYTTASATLFPEGPLKSSLQRVLLAPLAGNSLTSPQVRVSTQSDQKAYAEDSQFVYPIQDSRFEQVQVFYYISKTLDWSEKNLNFRPPFVIEAETSVGYPAKTNTAFYFRGRVRLGEGDDVTFSRIGLDPSIVVHETFHAFVEAVAGLPYQNEGGSLNEGFSDFFTALILENPRLGEASYKKAPFKRTVLNQLRFNDRKGALYFDSGVLSGLLWEVRTQLGVEPAKFLAWETLIRLIPFSNFDEARRELFDVSKRLPMDQQETLRQILQRRGWLEN